MSIKFAPLNVPLERRIQTLGAAFWFYSLIFGSLFCLIFFLLILISSYWPLALLYLTWWYYDRETPYKGGRRFAWAKDFPLWKYFIDFFPIRLEKTAELKADKNYLFCVYPHGILSAGSFGNFGTNYSDRQKLFPGLKFFGSTLGVHFGSPFFREYILGLGGISSSKNSLLYILNGKDKGNAILLIVGGASESLYAKPGSYHIILNKRKGFIKIALSSGSSLVPVFSFGEVDVYDQVSLSPGSKLDRFQKWFKNATGLMLCIPKGRGLFQYSFGLVPQRAPITTVVGKPIDVPRIENPTDEQVDHYHDLFKKELQELFEAHKAKYIANPEKTALIIE